MYGKCFENLRGENMILISHRGNLLGPDANTENNPAQVNKALDLGFEVEIDVWNINGDWFLGHDNPQYPIEPIFLRNTALWCHAKNLEALDLMTRMGVHCFWHQTDDYTLTSSGFLWTYPGKPYTSRSIAVKPEKITDNVKLCYGVCSDWVLKFREELQNDQMRIV